MTRILAFAGKKQSGKNACCSFLHGYQMRSCHIIKDFALDDTGNLVVDTTSTGAEGEENASKGILDVTRTDYEFSMWAIENMWPFIKHYSFASALKEIACGLFGLTKKQCYGTELDKNSPTWLKWEDMPGYKGGETGRMTAREFLQFFGTDLCRKIHPDIWTDRTLKSIREEESLMAVISDCRFPNEAQAVKKAGGKIIKLTRGSAKNKKYDSHSSETSVDAIKYDAVIDNKELSIMETNSEIVSLLEEWGWLGNVIEAPEEPPQEDPRLLGGITKIIKE
jgi:hypothetical protein